MTNTLLNNIDKLLPLICGILFYLIYFVWIIKENIKNNLILKQYKLSKQKFIFLKKEIVLRSQMTYKCEIKNITFVHHNEELITKN